MCTLAFLLLIKFDFIYTHFNTINSLHLFIFEKLIADSNSHLCFCICGAGKGTQGFLYSRYTRVLLLSHNLEFLSITDNSAFLSKSNLKASSSSLCDLFSLWAYLTIQTNIMMLGVREMKQSGCAAPKACKQSTDTAQSTPQHLKCFVRKDVDQGLAI